MPVFPYAIQSYAYALTPMTTRKFTVISFLTMMPACFIYSYLAAQILHDGFSAKLFLDLTVAGVLLAGLSMLPKMSRRLRHLSKEYKK